MPDWQQPIQVKCDHTGIHFSWGPHQRDWRWSDLYQIVEGKSHFVLLYESRRLVPVSKRWLTPELQKQLRDLAATGKGIDRA